MRLFENMERQYQEHLRKHWNADGTHRTPSENSLDALKNIVEFHQQNISQPFVNKWVANDVVDWFKQKDAEYIKNICK